MPNLPDLIGRPQAGEVQLLQAKVTAVGSGSVDVHIGDTTDVITGVKVLASVSVAVNDIVWILRTGGVLIVMGKLGLSVGGASYISPGLELYHPASTPYIDFHRAVNPAGDSNADYNVRLINDEASYLHLVAGSMRLDGWIRTNVTDTNGETFLGAWGATSNYSMLGSWARRQANSNHYVLIWSNLDANTFLSPSAAGGAVFIRRANNGADIAQFSESQVTFKCGTGSDKHTFHDDGEAWHNSIGVGGDNGYNSGIAVHNNWIRVYGVNGIIFENYGGGWFMQDSTYLRVQGNKTIYTAGMIRGDGGMTALGVGVYLKSEGDTTHRIYWHTDDAVRIPSWSYVGIEAVAHDHMVRCEAQTRHVNRANNAWRYSDAQGHTNFSDPKFKRAIKKVPLGKNKVKEIEPIEFQWDEKHDKREPGRKNFGFDASTLPPEVILKSYLANEETGEDEECLMMDPVGVMAIAWQAMRETIAQVDAFEDRLAALEKK